MRELTIRIRFTTASLGSVKKHAKDPDSGKTWPIYLMPRTADGQIRFESAWWLSSLRFAANVLCKHHKSVEAIHFDVVIDGRTDTNPANFFKRYFQSDGLKNGRSKSRFVKHEAFQPGDVIGVNCVVPSEISDDDFWKLMDLVGRFKGISPYGPRENGRFEVEAIRPKDRASKEDDNVLQRRECDPSGASDSRGPQGCE